MNQMSEIQSNSGQTILESIVALFIFGCVAGGILKGLGVADKIHSKAFIAMNATRIAENEFEHIRKKAVFQDAIEDCTWVERSSGREYQVQRKIHIPDSLKYQFDDNKPSLLEIELSIETRDAKKQKYQFRMLQGYSW